MDDDTSRYRWAGRKGARWRRVRLEVLERDGWTCAHCGRQADTVDHRIPLKNGGAPYDLDNLATLCRPCNSRKGDRLPAAAHPPAGTPVGAGFADGAGGRWSRVW